MIADCCHSGTLLDHSEVAVRAQSLSGVEPCGLRLPLAHSQMHPPDTHASSPLSTSTLNPNPPPQPPTPPQQISGPKAGDPPMPPQLIDIFASLLMGDREIRNR